MSLCLLPWLGLRIGPGGNAEPCACHWSGEPLGTVRAASFSELRNAAALKRTRLDMLAGRPGEHCGRCYELEAAGFESHRLAASRFLGRHADAVRRTGADGSIGDAGLRFLVIAFSNACGYRCRTCNPTSSTGWYEDFSRMRGVPAPPVYRPTEDPQELLEALEPHLGTLEVIQFAGGEPLDAPEHYRLLERLIERERFGVRLHYNTNLSTLRLGEWDALKLWRRFESVSVWASLDGSGARGEYLRKGQDWRKTLAERDRMMREAPGVDFGLACAASVFNAFHLPDFLREMIGSGRVLERNAQLNMVFDPPCYSTRALPARVKRAVAEHYRAQRWPEGMGAVAAMLESAISFMQAADWSDKLEEFRATTRALDALRNEDFRSVFPELAGLL